MSNKIIGREQEQLELKDIFNSPRAEFVAIYGRRRIGKTYLIHNFFINKNCIYFHAVGLLKGKTHEQLSNFTAAIAETFFGKASLKPANTWKEAFEPTFRS